MKRFLLAIAATLGLAFAAAPNTAEAHGYCGPGGYRGYGGYYGGYYGAYPRFSYGYGYPSYGYYGAYRPMYGGYGWGGRGISVYGGNWGYGYRW